MNTNKLKAKMVEVGMNQEKLARKLGITIQSLNAKINKRSEFKISEAEKLIEILKIENPIEIFFENYKTNNN